MIGEHDTDQGANGGERDPVEQSKSPEASLRHGGQSPGKAMSRKGVCISVLSGEGGRKLQKIYRGKIVSRIQKTDTQPREPEAVPHNDSNRGHYSVQGPLETHHGEPQSMALGRCMHLTYGAFSKQVQRQNVPWRSLWRERRREFICPALSCFLLTTGPHAHHRELTHPHLQVAHWPFSGIQHQHPVVCR